MRVDSVLRDLIGGYRGTALACVIARLGLADRLAKQPADAGTLAGELGLRADRLHQVLRASATLGLVEGRGDGTFAVTELGELLTTDHPRSQRSAAIYFGAVSAPSFAGLPASLSGDVTAFEDSFGQDFYGYLDTHPELAEHYNEIIAIPGLGGVLAKAWNFGSASVVVDVGGGRGSTLAELLRARPDLSGVLLEIPHVLDTARQILGAPDLAERASVRAGSFLDGVPGGGDVYMLCRVLANWDDEHCLRILRNCADALPPDGRVLVFDLEMPDPVPETSFAPIGDLHAFAHFGGRVRTADELDVLFAGSGLRRVGTFETSLGDGWRLVEAAGGTP